MKHFYRKVIQSFLFSLVIGLSVSYSQSCESIYVVPGGKGTGTENSPTNVVDAVAIANSSSSRKQIVLKEGLYSVEQTLVLKSGVRIEGAYTIVNGKWVKGDTVTNKSKLIVVPPYEFGKAINSDHDTVSVAHIIGIKLDSVKEVTLKDFILHVTTVGYNNDDAGGGYSIYCMYARKSTDINVVNVTFSSDNAGDGIPGQNGLRGRDADGLQGGGTVIDESRTTDRNNPVFKIRGNSNTCRAGGKGGIAGAIQNFVPCNSGLNCVMNSCIPEMPAPMGGHGQSSGFINKRYALAGGSGGVCGDPCKWDCYYDLYSQANPVSAGSNLANGVIIPEAKDPNARAGTNGQNATGLMDGIDYTGKEAQARPGELREFFIPSKGTKGGDGAGGSGGGGGGAGSIRVFALPPYGIDSKVTIVKIGVERLLQVADVDVCNAEILNFPGKGGRGGAGGEGGEGGEGGGGGGGTFGIYFTENSKIKISPTCKFQLGNPGMGGAGGLGGAAGLGSKGDAAPTPPTGMGDWNTWGAKGGDGGDGANGGKGQNGGRGVTYNVFGSTGTSFSGVIADYKKACTNSVIGVYSVSDKDKIVAIAPAAYVVDVPPATSSSANLQARYIYTTSFSDITAIAYSNSTNSETARITFNVNTSRPLPVMNPMPSVICDKDTFRFSTNETASKYLWKVFDANGTILKVSEKTADWFLPSAVNVDYYVGLQTYDECCGWSVSVFHKFQNFKSFIKPELLVTGSTGPYCFGTDSTWFRLVDPSLPGQRIWTNGSTNDFGTYITTYGYHSVILKFDNGCYSLRSDSVKVSAIPLPQEKPTPITYAGVCDRYPNSIVPELVPMRSFTFYASKVIKTPLPDGADTWHYNPSFRFSAITDTVTYWYALTDFQTKCSTKERAPVYYIVEKNPPTVTSPNYYTYGTSFGKCGTNVYYQDPQGFDDCAEIMGFSMVEGKGRGAFFPVGKHTEKFLVGDLYGNKKDFALTINVVDDAPPTVTYCPKDTTLNADLGGCSVKFDFPLGTAIDNCTNTLTPSFAFSGNSYSDKTFGIGTTNIKMYWTDGAGNTSTCSYNVFVKDTEVPVVTNCPEKLDRYVEKDKSTADVGYQWPQVTDNCFSRIDFVSGAGAASSARGVGSTTEVYKIYDAQNTLYCTFKVNVIDTISPKITCPSAINLKADAGKSYTTVTYSMPSALDNCVGTVNVYKVSGKASGDTASLGMQTIIWEAKDASGNTSQCSIPLTVSDTEAPQIICPASFEREIDQGICGAVIQITIPKANDNDGSSYPVVLRSGIASGQTFPMGTTQHYYTSTDASGNKSHCVFSVTVKDTQAPVFATCPHDTTIYIAGGGCSILLNKPAPVATDNSCAVAWQGFVSGEPYNIFPVGTTKQVYKASDASSNVGTCSFNVTIKDTTSFTYTCTPPYTVNTDPGLCGAVVNYPKPKIAPFYGNHCYEETLFSGLAPGSVFPLGTTSILYKVKIGQRETTCSTTITVVDNERPKISCRNDTAVFVMPGICGARVNFIEPVGTDNCTNGLGTTRLKGLAPGSIFPVGVTIQKYQVSNSVTNQLDTCSFTVVVKDTTKPAIVAPADITVSTSEVCGTVVSFAEPVGTDNSGCATTTLITGLHSGQVFPVGTTLQTYQVRDAAGNVDTCRFTVKVEGTEPLTVGCLSPPPAYASNGLGAVVSYDIPGNYCSGTTTFLKSGLGSGAFFKVGMNKDVYEIRTKDGKVASCTINVHVFESNPPVVACKDFITVDVHPDSITDCKASIKLPKATATDLSGIQNLFNEYNGKADASGIYPLGTTNVYWKAIDSSGFTGTCASVVTVKEKLLKSPLQTIPYQQMYCAGETFVYDPKLDPYSGTVYKWTKNNATSVVSTEKILVLPNLKKSDEGIYRLYLSSSCTAPQLVNTISLVVNSGPGATLSGLDAEYCVTDVSPKTITASPAGGVLSGAGVAGNQFYPNLAGVGTHTILYVTNISGVYNDGDQGLFPWSCTDTARLIVRVNALPEQTAFALPEYCVTVESVKLDSAYSTYSGTAITGIRFSPKLAGGGIHTISRTITKGTCSITYTNDIKVNDAIPDATILTKGPFCDNSGYKKLKAAEDGGIWSGPAVVSDTVNHLALFNPRQVSAGLVALKYEITKGVCSASDSVNVQVNLSNGNYPFTFPEYCRTDDPVIWDTVSVRLIGEGFTANKFSPKYFAEGGVKFYAAVTTNNSGCRDTTFRMLWIHGPDVPFNKEQLTCFGDSVYVDLKAGYTSVKWDNGSELRSRWLSKVGEYKVALADTFGCEGVDTIKFGYYPKVLNKLERAGNTLESYEGKSYQWYSENGKIAGATSQYYTITEPGKYYVILTDSNGCLSYSDTLYVKITSVILGVDNYSVSIYPNPSTDKINIHYVNTSTDKLLVKILSPEGKILHLESVEDFNGEYNKAFDMNGYSNGVYLLQIITDEGTINEKIVKVL